jgi:glycerol-3-phosphate acyltransferase PlsY
MIYGVCYLLGALPFGVIISRLFGKNIFKIGSGSTGFTNVKRAVGLWPALIVLLLDFGKGYLATAIAAYYLTPRYELIVLGGLLAIVGHSLSVFIRFKGGKGAATGVGIVAFIDWRIFLIVAIIVFLIVKFLRIQSVGTLAGMWLTTGLFFIFKVPEAYLYASLIANIFIMYTHRQNIVRLLQGKENRIA